MDWQAIERDHPVEFPGLYKRLAQDGMLNWGDDAPDWSSNFYKRHRDDPPLLLNSHDFELLTATKISRALAEIRDPGDYRHIDSALNLLPFAQDNSGELFGFLTPSGNLDQCVGLVCGDEDRIDLLAPDLESFIFRKLLEDASQLDEDQLDDQHRYFADCQATLRTHARYLSESHQNTLREIYLRPVVRYTYRLPAMSDVAHGQLTRDELVRILNENLGRRWIDAAITRSSST